MTFPCAICGESVDERGLLAGRCHGCRAEFKELLDLQVGHPSRSNQWKDYVSPTKAGRSRQLRRIISKKLQVALDRLENAH